MDNWSETPKSVMISLVNRAFCEIGQFWWWILWGPLRGGGVGEWFSVSSCFYNLWELNTKRGNCLYLENENTLRTDSQDYGTDEILYSAGIALFEKIIGCVWKCNSFQGLTPGVSGPDPRCFKMRICFGPILTLPMSLRINENTVWTDSQDYGADEI